MNVEFATQVADFLEANPEKHNQDIWLSWRPECGTVGCVAGWACVLSGRVSHKSVFNVNESEFDEPRDPVEYMCVARDLLGIREREAARLFLLEEESSAIAYLRVLIAAETVSA